MPMCAADNNVLTRGSTGGNHRRADYKGDTHAPNPKSIAAQQSKGSPYTRLHNRSSVLRAIYRRCISNDQNYFGAGKLKKRASRGGMPVS